MATGRNHLGCWTCRLRRKKCDEATPVCATCKIRDLPCHGYGDKPSSFDGGERERDELAKIKTAVKLSIRRRRASISRRSATSSGTKPASTTTPAFDSGETVHSPVSSALSASNVAHRISSYREAELLMHYIDHVFPLQFRFHTPKSSGRGWLFWLLINTGPLYHAALSLSALHQYKASDTSNVENELSSYHARALADLHSFVGDIREGNLENITDQIQILSCGVSLISFELFRGGSDDWRPHLDALTYLPVVQDPALWRTVEIEDWQRAALSFLVHVTTWFDLLACASTGTTPRVPYQRLLGAPSGNLLEVMGCDDRVMVLIGDLAHLHDWKLSQQSLGMLSIPELVSRSDKSKALLQRDFDSTTSSTVTRAFAAGALVLSHVIVSGAYPALPEIQQSVEAALTTMEEITDAHEIRGLVWPLCVSACLATARLRPRFETILSHASSGSRTASGTAKVCSG